MLTFVETIKQNSMTLQDLKENREEIINTFFKLGGDKDKLKAFMNLAVMFCEEANNVDELIDDCWTDGFATWYKETKKERLAMTIGEMNLNEELKMNDKGFYKNPISRTYQKIN
jgi:hypothetical protein